MIIKQFTVSTYILKDKKVLLIHHPKFQKWLPPGGHLEANETPPEGAKREVLEETGLEVAFITQENIWVNCWNAVSFERPYFCLLEEVPQQGPNPPHQHMDLIYLATPVSISPEHEKLLSEGALRWFSLEEVLDLQEDIEIFGETQKVISQILNESTLLCR